MIYTRLIKYIPYAFMAIVIASWYYTYTSAITENEELKASNKVLIENETKIIEAYETSAIVIEQVAYEEGLNKGASLVSEIEAKKIKKLTKERHFEEINNDVYRTTSF